MIDARALYDLFHGIIAKLTEGDSSDAISGATPRDHLTQAAGFYDLDLDQTATLFRVAAGELPMTPTYHTYYLNDRMPTP